MTPDRLDRFARHIVLPELGGAGQARLVQAHVVLVGVGGSAIRPCSIWQARGSGG